VAKPLRLFIQSPSASPPFSDWSLVHGYGPEDPEPETGPRFHNSLLLNTTGSGDLFAAANGKLSVLLPGSSWLDPHDEIALPEPGNHYPKPLIYTCISQPRPLPIRYSG
jgi:hypothetical protein